ncbi:uncharacterized protein BJX67DRAFT_384979 [Aspergillus lucknowensis]|uniref:Uncharacterized protein n=1 Tax=Aspergillus lucknowensis TaxID=176173 RepID=A0ABR4LF03_9EURO
MHLSLLALNFIGSLAANSQSQSSSPVPPLPTPSQSSRNTTLPCTIISQVTHSFYGISNNENQGPNIAYDCGRSRVPGGLGTYINPLTFASAPGEFQRCEVIYSPYLQKYLRHEDYCSECNSEWSERIYHVRVWVGSNLLAGGEDEIDCERRLEPPPERTQSVIRYPRADLIVDTTPLYVPGFNTPSACHVDHVYPSYALRDYC